MKFILILLANTFCQKFYLYKIEPHQQVHAYKIHQHNNEKFFFRQVVGCYACLADHAQVLNKMHEKNPISTLPHNIDANTFEDESINNAVEENEEKEEKEDEKKYGTGNFVAKFLTLYLCGIFLMALGFYYRDIWIVRKIVSFLKWLVKKYEILCTKIARLFESREARELRLAREERENFTFSFG